MISWTKCDQRMVKTCEIDSKTIRNHVTSRVTVAVGLDNGRFDNLRKAMSKLLYKEMYRRTRDWGRAILSRSVKIIFWYRYFKMKLAA